ncbi:MAG TPA: DUF6427 family protein [Ohtaekwangia sp.]
MLSYFRINDPYRLLGAFVILLIISIPRLIDYPGLTYPELKSILIGEKVHEGLNLYDELIDSTGPLNAWSQAFIEWIFGRSLLARHILTLFALFLQAAFLGIVFSEKKAFSENTYIPSLIVVILACFSFDMLSLSAELLGSGVLLLALNSMFREMEFRDRPDSTFKIGFYISLASLFLFSYAIFLPGAIIFLSIFTRSTWRKYLLMIIGFLLPHFLLMSIYFINDHLYALWQHYYLPNFSFGGMRQMEIKDLMFLGIFPILYLLVSFFILNREARFTKYQSQLVQIMFFWMLFSLIQIFYSKELRPQSFITLLPVFAFYMTHFILLIRRRKFAEISIWIFLLGTVAIGYLAQYGKLESIGYEKLILSDRKGIERIENKSVLLLDDDLSVYKSNKLGSGFLNWNMSEEIFREPDTYENVEAVYHSFKKDKPEIILDPKNYMQAYLKRIPELRAVYRKTGDGFYELIQNQH